MDRGAWRDTVHGVRKQLVLTIQSDTIIVGHNLVTKQPVFLPGKSHGQRRLVGYSPWGCKELDTTEQQILLGRNSYTRELEVSRGQVGDTLDHKEKYSDQMQREEVLREICPMKMISVLSVQTSLFLDTFPHDFYFFFSQNVKILLFQQTLLPSKTIPISSISKHISLHFY